MFPLISVIVPVYNVERYLNQCVDSIIGQSYSNLEVFLVDDGSTDSCPEICDFYAEKDSRVHVIHKKNGGQSSARNMALDLCTGDYIAFVDSDDWIEQPAFSEMMDFIQDAELDIVYIRPNEIIDDKIEGSRYHYYDDKTVCDAKEIMLRTLKSEISSEPWLKMCHRHCWEDVRFPEGRIYEDVAVAYIPLEKAERPVGFLDRLYYNYRINRTGTTMSRKPVSRYHFFLAMLDRYEYAKTSAPEALDAILCEASRFAMGTFLDYHVNRWNELEPYQDKVESFLNEHKRELLKIRMTKSQRMSLRLYYINRYLFAKMYGIMLPILKRRWSSSKTR